MKSKIRILSIVAAAVIGLSLSGCTANGDALENNGLPEGDNSRPSIETPENGGANEGGNQNGSTENGGTNGGTNGGSSENGGTNGGTSGGVSGSGGASQGGTTEGGTTSDSSGNVESDLTQSAEEIIGGTYLPEMPDKVPEGATHITDKITITEGGDYYVDSAISGKKITVDCEGVNLYLSGATLSNEKKVIECSYGLNLILLGESTLTNSNADGSNAIDCAGDLVISGDGSLNVSSTKNAIKAKSITVEGATLYLNSEKDGLHAEVDEYDDAETEPVPSYGDGGFVYLSGAKVTINSVDDGIQADTFVYITEDSVLDITAGGGAPTTVTSTTSDNASGKGIKAGAIDWGADATDLVWDGYLVCIKSGTITINSNDDALHSDGDIEISGGTITASTGDDGIHADNNLLINGGSVGILKSYEGIEGTNIVVSGGKISVISTDDGLNAAGGADSSGFGGMDTGGWGHGFGNMGKKSISGTSTTSSETPYINISGGVINIDSTADGIDSNGNITISGGEVYISGPTSGADAAVDFDGVATVTGGVVVAVGKNGMAQNFGSSSTQGCVLLTTSSSGTGAVALKDSSGNTLVSYTPSKSYNCVLISCHEMVKGSTYTLSACGKSTSLTLTSLVMNKSF